MNEVFVYSLIMLLGVFVASCSQILLKKSADKQYKNILAEYLNARVITAYAMFFVSALVGMYVLRYIPLSLAPILESGAYVFVAVLSFCILKERMSKRNLLGIGLIIVGTIVFVL